MVENQSLLSPTTDQMSIVDDDTVDNNNYECGDNNNNYECGGVCINNNFVRNNVKSEICKQVIRCKLVSKRRHLVLKKVIDPTYLDSLFPLLLQHFQPQHVTYNGGIANVKEWKISCYLEVMEGGIPTTQPNIQLRNIFLPLLQTCNDLFLFWYQQQHACNNNKRNSRTLQEPLLELTSEGSSSSSPSSRKSKATTTTSCRRLMTFITRYTPAPGEQALLKHVDGAGKVDGSIVLALPIDRWSAPMDVNQFEGGGLTFWDGRKVIVRNDNDDTSSNDDDNNNNNNNTTKKQSSSKTTIVPEEIHYDTRSGDMAFIDRAVWHQADPITKGTRWALVIFYKVD